MEDYASVARRLTGVLSLSQCLSSTGFVAAFTVKRAGGIRSICSPNQNGLPCYRLLQRIASSALWVSRVTVPHAG